MNLKFIVKYGKNILELPLPNGEIIKTEFVAKYGKNKVLFATKPVIMLEFTLKYGENSVYVEIPQDVVVALRLKNPNDKFTDKVTIYNDIASDGVNPRRFDRFVIDKCLVYEQLTESADSTIQRVINAQNVITKDTEHYKSPLEYARLPVDVKEQYYTVQVDDFIVLAEVDDVVTTSREFQDLQEKYKDNGFSVTAVSTHLKGTITNNIHIMHA